MQEFFRAHNISDMLERVDLSTMETPTNQPDMIRSRPPPHPVNGQDGGLVGVTSLEDWTRQNGESLRQPNGRESLMSMGTEISEVSSLGILPIDDLGELLLYVRCV